MTTFANQLKSYAQGLYKESPEAVAVGILVKQAGLSEQEATDLVLTSSIEKAACDALAAKGVDNEVAANLVKIANLDISKVKSMFTLERNPALSEAADVLEKAASYVESLENQIQSMQAELIETSEELDRVSSLYKEAQVSDPLEKIASSGMFTQEELERARGIDADLLQKLASASASPWEMGGASGRADISDADPLTKFLMG
jgi:hypothetical protein